MAIQRCPYCKAIIDEGAEYCTNCGTKLLFPEDEFVEEEIPGEQIIDVDEDMTGTQQELEEPPIPDADEEFAADAATEAGEGEAQVDDEDSEAPAEAAEEEAVEESLEEEAAAESPEENGPAPKKPRKPRTKAAPSKTEAEEEPAGPGETDAAPGTEEVKVVEDDLPAELDEELEEEPVPEEELTPQPGTVDEREWQTPPPMEDLQEPGAPGQDTVETGDIEEIVDEAEKEKEEIDKFIASVKKERQARSTSADDDTQDVPPWVSNVEEGPLPDIPPTDEVVMAEGAPPEPYKEHVEESTEEPKDEPSEEPVEQPMEEPAEGTADRPLEVPSGLEEESPDETETAEAPAPGYDTRSAFPETVDQQGLPFASKTEHLDDSETSEGIPHEESRTEREAAPMGFVDWIKARAFDVIFVAALWFVALWIASQVLSVSVFSIISGSAIVVILFLAILLAIYFFYFLYFLGETLGNYLFSSDE